MDFASNTGVYCLIIKLLQRCHIKIGCLGTFHFPAGFYVYVGSAQNNLKRRIGRHLRQEKKIRWHIDYLLRYGEVASVHTYAGGRDMECVLSHKIGNLKDASLPVKGFGSSDCSCYSHLYFFQDDPALRISSLIIKMKHPSPNGHKGA
jgi:Uri superfamily endonuclease